jgi:fluoroacetyl-CoA thioesterase
LAPGLRGHASFRVEANDLVNHVPGGVLATPAMIAFIEYACASELVAHLDDGETTVGTHVCVSHEGPAWSGEQIRIEYHVQTVERRRIMFAVQAASPRGLISRGTHERAVIELARYESQAPTKEG